MIAYRCIYSTTGSDDIVNIDILFSICFGFVFMVLTPYLSEKIIEYKNKLRNNEDKLVSRAYPKLLFMAYAFFLTFFVVSFSFSNYYWWKIIFITVFCFITCIGTLVDIRVRIIPNEMVLMIIVLGIFLRFIEFGFAGLLNSFLTVLGTVAFMFLSYFITKAFYQNLNPFGAGDMKLILAVAFVMGYPDVLGAFTVCIGTMLAYISVGMLFKKLHMRSYIPMAGFILIGLVSGLLYGRRILDVIGF